MLFEEFVLYFSPYLDNNINWAIFHHVSEGRWVVGEAGSAALFAFVPLLDRLMIFTITFLLPSQFPPFCNKRKTGGTFIFMSTV